MVQNMVNLKTKGIILFIMGVVLFSCPAQARRIKKDTLKSSVQRLSVSEAQQVLLGSIVTIRDNFPRLIETTREGLLIYETEGLDAFEEKVWSDIQEANKTIKDAINRINALSGYIGFEADPLRQMVDEFLQDIAHEMETDKIMIGFGGDFSFNVTFSLGLSDLEHAQFIEGLEDIGYYFRSLEKGSTMDSTDLESKALKGQEVLQSLGIHSGAHYQGHLTLDAKKLVFEDFIQYLIVGRTEAGINQGGEFSDQDSQRLEALIRERLDVFRQIRSALFKEWAGFCLQSTMVKHRGGVDELNFKLNATIDYLPKYLEGMRNGGLDNAEHEEHFLNILRVFANLESPESYQAFNDLNTYIDLVKMGIDFSPQDITPVLKERIEYFRGQVEQKGLDYKIAIGVEDAIINCDLNQIAFIVDTLIENAIKYTPQGAVRVAVTQEHGEIGDIVGLSGTPTCDYLEIIVGDTGIGIPKEDIYKVEHRGFRAGNVGEIEGTGVGLDLAYNIIASNLHGFMTIVSELNEGTCVVIRLPIVSSP